MFHLRPVHSAITTAQSVAEGLAKFAAERHEAPVRFHMDELRQNVGGERIRRASVPERIGWLEAETDIDACCIAAFRRLHNAQRNDFHHMNRAAPTLERQRLEEIAEQCLQELFRRWRSGSSS